MAKAEHIALLRQGADTWNAWRRKAAENPDLSGGALRSFDFSGYDLSHADLRGADLRGARFSEASLIRADLRGANLFKAVLDRADLAEASLSAALFLNCAQLAIARHWQSAFRDPELACGALLPYVAR